MYIYMIILIIVSFHVIRKIYSHGVICHTVVNILKMPR